MPSSLDDQIIVAEFFHRDQSKKISFIFALVITFIETAKKLSIGNENNKITFFKCKIFMHRREYHPNY